MNHNDLPVMDVLPQLHQALCIQKAAVLIAPPGAGKTTAVPLSLLKEPWLEDKKIILLEPRRLAARIAARRMAKNLHEEVGKTVGYRMRMDTRVSKDTKIEVVTEGVFQRIIRDDPELSDVACVIFDEFHERSLDADFGLALTLDMRSALRDDLRVLIMSATLDGDRIARFIGNVPVIESLGRMYPVDICYHAKPAGQRLEEVVATTIKNVLADEDGSILVFLPGQVEIRRVHEQLENRLPDNVFIAPLFGAMDIRDQDIAVQIAPKGQRKIVLATPLAESSITIDGVRIVIDSGLVRVPIFEANLGISRLETRRASKASIEQRAGRAGRTAPGVAIRLWQEEQTAILADFEQPEIMQSDLSSLLLDSAAWGVTDPINLSFLDNPPAIHLAEARKLLIQLGALDNQGQITAKGKLIGKTGLEPRLAAMVIAGQSPEDKVRRAFLAILIRERGVGGQSVDLEVRFENAWRKSNERIKKIKDMAKRIAKKCDTQDKLNENPVVTTVGQMLCDAYPDRLAKQRDNKTGHYVMVNGRGVIIDGANLLAQNPFLIVADLAGNATNARIVSAAIITQQMVLDRFADKVACQTIITFDKPSGKLRARQIHKLGAIQLASTAVTVKPGEQAIYALIDAIICNGLDLLDWSKSAGMLRKRLSWLYIHDALNWPDMSDNALIETIDEWLTPFLVGKTDLFSLSDTDLCHALMARIPFENHAQLDRLAPSHFTVPTGSKIPLIYQLDEKPPVLSVRVQELFGLNEHPSICNGQIHLTLELLSPAHRPIQITRDLPGFWKGSWADMRADMRGRYPKHEWPEDPANAMPTKRAKQRK